MGSHGQDGHGELPEDVREQIIQLQQEAKEGRGLQLTRALAKMQESVKGHPEGVKGNSRLSETNRLVCSQPRGGTRGSRVAPGAGKGL